MMKGKRWAVWLFLWIVGGLLLWVVGQCRFYAFQNRSLSAENRELSDLLADRNQTIDEKMKEIESLQARLADMLISEPEEVETESGFLKMDGVYLIDTEEQLYKLRDMLRDEAEVEPGVPAAEASWRLRNNVILDDDMWFCLGTEENPFCGSFDGDGHSIQGRFPLMNSVTPKALFHMDEQADIENLHILNDQSEGKIHVEMCEIRDCDELEKYLPGLPGCSVHAEIREWGLDVEQTVRALRRHWEQDDRWDGYSVSLTLHPNMFEEDRKPADSEKELQGMQDALLTLGGPEYAEMIREAMEQEEGCLWFVRLEQVGELTCCTFEITEPEYHPDTYEDGFGYTDIGYYIIVDGKWEGKEVLRQCFRIPYTYWEMYSIGINETYRVEAVDFNFDGKQDLLIHESGEHYRALVWKEGRFAYFPSFPENVYLLQFDRKRVVNRGEIGGCHEFIEIFEIVNGEYECTKELDCEFHDGIYELSYYEMGELVETHRLSSDDWEEVERQRGELYPDMDYWLRG